MQETHCLLCYAELETRDVAPCAECGSDPQELEHFAAGKHGYAEYEVFPRLRLILCDFCAVDFSSCDPAFFGLPPQTRLGLGHMSLMRCIENPTITKDKCCPNCGFRLPFLRFVHEARQRHATK